MIAYVIYVVMKVKMIILCYYEAEWMVVEKGEIYNILGGPICCSMSVCDMYFGITYCIYEIPGCLLHTISGSHSGDRVVVEI